MPLTLSQADADRQKATFAKYMMVAAAFIALLPALIALMVRPAGSSYLGSEYNQDDHMVYAAWMRQAMDGKFFFDNRFAVDSQPGLTVHVYFFALGLVAKVIGIPATEVLARVLFSVLLVFLLDKLLRRITNDVYVTKLCLSLAVVGGGIGFVVWQNFGQVLSADAPAFLGSLLSGRLPTDVWQPEGFVFSSMLSNSLFVASLCLTLTTLLAFLSAEKSWKHVAIGFLGIGLLMNIHSYDVLLMALVMSVFLIVTLAQKQLSTVWLARALAISAGVAIPALWFMHVLKLDPVFQARAATLTYSPNFRQVLGGYAPLFLLATIGFLKAPDIGRNRRIIGTACVGVLGFIGFVLAAGHGDGYWMGVPAWAASFVAVAGCAVVLSNKSPAWNLVVCWALVGMVAIYFPGLFQRKLTMGLSVPWAILAGIGLSGWVKEVERGTRNLLMVLVLVITGGTTLRWIERDSMLIRKNVSNTILHPVYLSPDMKAIAAYLNANVHGRTVLVSMPGVSLQTFTNDGPVPDSYETPLMPDLNPIMSGLTGVYTYAGHWSETPDYGRRRAIASAIYSPTRSLEEREAALNETQADYLIAPVQSAFPIRLPTFRMLGQVVYEGSQFQLLKVQKQP